MPILTLSGNEITDALRALGAEGDGLASPDSSMGIWPAATNLITNGGFETNDTGWSGGGTRSATQAKFGIYSLHFISTGQFSLAQCLIGVTSGTTYTASMWVYRTEITQTWALKVAHSEGASYGNTTIPTALGWNRVSFTFTADATADIVIQTIVTTTGASDIYVDGVQLETGPIATPYIETDGGAAARAAARVQVPVAGLFTPTQGWMAARVRMGWVNTADPSANPTLFQWKDDANNLLELRYDTTSNLWELQRRNTGGTGESTKADTFALSDLVTIIAAWDSANLKVSIDGSAFVSVAATNIPTLAAASADIGSAAGTAEHIAGDVLWFAAGSGTLTDADAAAIHAFGNTDPPVGRLPGQVKMLWAGIGAGALGAGGDARRRRR